MTSTAFGGMPAMYFPDRRTGIWTAAVFSAADITVANDVEEVQFIGRIAWEGYATSKTVSSAGGSLGWLPGASTTFNATSTLRVGLKQASSISTASGPPPRATTGTAAFDVYKDLVGGTDTISSTTWRNDAFSNGSLSLSHGDQVAVCMYLSKSSGTSSVKVRGVSETNIIPSSTLVTSSGATFTAQSVLANFVITADDGTVGTLYGAYVFTAGATVQSAIGNGGFMGNKFRLNVPVKVDGIAVNINAPSNGDFEVAIYTDTNPPVAVSGTQVAVDANQLPQASTNRPLIFGFAGPVALSAGTDYVVGVKQTTANSVAMYGWTVDSTTHWKLHALGATCLAVSSSGGAFSAMSSSKMRLEAYAFVSHFDDGAGGGGGMLYVPNLAGT